jgi:hypothetical protein
MLLCLWDNYMQFQAQIQITMYAHMLKTKERAHIVGMRRVGMRSKDKNKEEMRQTCKGYGIKYL